MNDFLKNIPYKLSTNYEILWKIITEGKRIAGFVHNRKVDMFDIVEIKKPFPDEKYYIIGSRGIGYEGWQTYNGFIDVCTIYNLHFIEPNL